MEKRTSHRLVWVGLILGLIAAAALWAVLFFRIPDGIRLSRLLEDTLSEQNCDYELSLSTNLQGSELRLRTECFRRTSSGDAIYGCVTEGIPLFYANNRLIFDNGRAFDLGDLIELPSVDTEKLSLILPFARVQKQQRGTETVYSLRPDAATMQRMVSDFPPTAVAEADITEHGGRLSALRLHLQDGERYLTLELSRLSDPDRPIAEAVWSAVNAEDVQTVEVFFPLARALHELSETDPLCAELAVSADCGPIALTDTMMLYSTESGTYLQRRGSLKKLTSVDNSNLALIGLGYRFCRDGRFSRVGDSGSYSLVFPAADVRDTCVEMLPEIEALPITYENGSLVLTVEEGALYSIQFDVGGEMPFLFTTVGISLGVDLQPVPAGSLTLPDGIQ